LGKTLTEIQDLTVDEYNGWIAYFSILSEKD